MKMLNKSGPAIFMYCVIALSLVISVVCFSLYYSETLTHTAILWVSITFFTIMYHLWLRLIMGNVTKLFHLKYTMWWYKERSFENNIYQALRVKSWKNKTLTYNPELFSLKDYSLDSIANTMCKAETDHEINVLISLSTLLFSLIWGQLWIFAITALAAIIFDSQFIFIQRYNRPRVVRLINRQKQKVKQ